jgi:hypothetical protein
VWAEQQDRCLHGERHCGREAEGGSGCQPGQDNRERKAKGGESVEPEEEVAQQNADLGGAAVDMGEEGGDAGNDRKRRRQAAEMGPGGGRRLRST